jgi:hypothetical protein
LKHGAIVDSSPDFHANVPWRGCFNTKTTNCGDISISLSQAQSPPKETKVEAGD